MTLPIPAIRRTSLMLGVCMGLCFTPGLAGAHGGLGHIQVTAWAAENLPEGELREFLAQEDIFNSLLFGSAYTDIGYYPGLPEPELVRAIAEYSHWTPFTQTFIDWVRENDPPPWTTLESRKRIAFLLGNAAHGFQDEFFDSLFLDQVAHHDGQGQPEADPATDGFLAMDDLVGMIPKEGIPVSTLLELYNSSGMLEKELTEEVLVDSMYLMTSLYIDEGAGETLATIAAERLLSVLEWTRINYMNPDIPGSLHAEIYPTMRYMQALWKQLNGTYTDEDVIMYSFPESERRLRSHVAGPPDSWVSVLFSTGIDYGAVTTDWQSTEGDAAVYDQQGQQWGGGLTRVLRLKPTEDLTPGGYYTVTINTEGVPGVAGASWDLEHNMNFQVACDEATAGACEDTGELSSARLDGADDFKAEWTDATSWEAPVPEPEDEGCSATGGGLYGLLVLGMLIRRRRYRS